MATSMMMCLQTQGVQCDEDEVASVMGVRPMQGATWEDAIACAQHYGMRAVLVCPATVLTLKKWTDAGIPVMIAWNPEGRDWSHASVVFDVEEREDGLYVHVADPNIPNPTETVRVVHENDFYGKWSEKWPKYLVRRPAMAVMREISPEGRQMVASVADSFRRAARPPFDTEHELKGRYTFDITVTNKKFPVGAGRYDMSFLVSAETAGGKTVTFKTDADGVKVDHLYQIKGTVEQIPRRGRGRHLVLNRVKFVRGVKAARRSTASSLKGRLMWSDLGLLFAAVEKHGERFDGGELEDALEWQIGTFWEEAAKANGWEFDGGYRGFDVEFPDGTILDDPSDVEVKVRIKSVDPRGLGGTEYTYDVELTVPGNARYKEAKMRRRSARKPKGWPTGTNAFAVYSMLKKMGYIPERVEQVDFRHLKRVFVWGGLEKRPGGGFQLTDKGKGLLDEFGYLDKLKRERPELRLAGVDPPYEQDGKPIYPKPIDHGYDQPLSGGHDIMKRLQDQLVQEQGRPDWDRPDNPRLARRVVRRYLRGESG
jgi:hypothetical protein